MNICPISRNTSNKSSNLFELANTEYEFSIHESIAEIEDFWSVHESKHNIFLSCAYFRVLEECPPDDLEQRYVVLRNGEDLVALYPMQLKLFEAKESMLDIAKEETSHIRKKLASHVRFNTLISGNIIISGEYMHAYVLEGLSPKEQFELTEKVITAYRDVLSKDGYKVNMTFIKDFPEVKSLSNLQISSSFKEFQVEPIMVFYLKEEWEKMEDYLASMTSKYRVRAKRAFKKAVDINFRECDLQEIEENCDQFYELYQNVLSNINFSLFKLIC